MSQTSAKPLIVATVAPPAARTRRSARSGRAWLAQVLLPALSAAVITPLVILQSMRVGRLLCPPGYDDVAYFLDATTRLNALREQGIGKFASDLVSWPPHAPFSSVLAALGFTVFGNVSWAPYAMNGVVVALWIGLAAYIVRRRPLWERVLVVLLLALMPMTLMAVHEFRPDMLAATLVGWSVVLALEGPILSRRAGELFPIGIVLGAAMIAKPSTSPSTLATVGVACAIAALVDRSRVGAGWWTPRLRAAGWVLLGCAVVAGPYFAVAWEDVYRYIHDNIFGYRRHMWVVPGSTAFHMRYYIDGKGGEFQLGPYAYPLIALAVLGGMLAPKLAEIGQRGRSLALLVAMLTAYAVASTNVMKQPFLGLQFQVLLVVAGLFSLRLMLDRGPRLAWQRVPIASALLPIALVLAAATFRWPNTWGSAETPRFVHGNRLYFEVNRVVRQQLGAGPASVFVTFSGVVNETNLELAAARRRDKVYFQSREVAASMEDFEPYIAKAQMVIAAQSGTGLTNDQFPCANLADAVVARLDKDRRFVRVASLAGATPERRFYVYRRARPRR